MWVVNMFKAIGTVAAGIVKFAWNHPLLAAGIAWVSFKLVELARRKLDEGTWTDRLLSDVLTSVVEPINWILITVGTVSIITGLAGAAAGEAAGVVGRVAGDTVAGTFSGLAESLRTGYTQGRRLLAAGELAAEPTMSVVYTFLPF